MRKCFTITAFRKSADILEMEEKLVKTNLYQGCEIFYPYNVSDERANKYLEDISVFTKYPNFEIVCHLPYGNDNNLASYINIDVIMHRMYDAIDFSNKFNVKKLTLHPGFYDQTINHQEALNLAINNIKKLCKYANKYNMYIMIENLVGKNELCKTTSEFLEIKAQVNMPNLKLIYDCGHYHASYQDITSSKNITDFIYQLKDDLFHLHLSDNDGTTDMHAKLGQGTINFKDYFKALKDINYNGLYCSEILFTKVDELLATARLFDDMFKNS